jgi:3-oxoacyl-[acyl-carrier-protein] synthase-1
MIDTAGAMRVAMAPWLDITCDGVARFEALLLPAIEQALLPLATTGGEQLRVALALGLPAGRPEYRVTSRPSPHENRAGFSNRFSAVAILPVGHAAGFLGVHAAHRRILDGEFDACVVSGWILSAPDTGLAGGERAAAWAGR